jgi:O-antigen ligase
MDAMHGTQLKRWALACCTLLVILVPLSFSIEKHVRVLPIALLFLTGLWLLAAGRAVRRDYRYAWPALVPAALMVALSVVNIWQHQLDWREFDQSAHIIMYAVIAAVFSLGLSMRKVWNGFSLTLIFLGAVSIVQHHFYGVLRPAGLNGGPASTIEFATVMLGLTLLALLQLLNPKATRGEKWLHGAAMALGLYGALLTQSRGPLLAFVPAFALVMALHGYRKGLRRRQWLPILVIGIAAALTAAANLDGRLIERFASISQEVSSYNPNHDAKGAVRERLEMWRTAVRAFKEHPLAGVGIDRFGTYIRSEVAAGRTNAAVAQYGHPHNEYLDAAATRGIFGLVVLVLLFVLPFFYFFRHAADPDDAVSGPAYAGLAIVVLYAVCALTESVLFRVMSQSLFFFLLLGLAVRVGNGLRCRAEKSGAA